MSTFVGLELSGGGEFVFVNPEFIVAIVPKSVYWYSADNPPVKDDEPYADIYCMNGLWTVKGEASELAKLLSGLNAES